MPVLLPLIANIFSNLKKMKNRYSYATAVQQFALSLFILGGRNCYEFLRLNLLGAFPHSSNLESIIRQKEMQMIEGEFRFQLVGDYLRSNKCQYAFSCEDCTSAISRIDYNAQCNSFIGLSSPLTNGVPQTNFFQTDDFAELRSWTEGFNGSQFISLSFHSVGVWNR